MANKANDEHGPLVYMSCGFPQADLDTARAIATKERLKLVDVIRRCLGKRCDEHRAAEGDAA